LGSDVEVALAFVARRQARAAMPANRWCHLLSLELGWMNPGQARAFVDRAVRAGLLAEDGADLRLVVDPARVEVPRGFRPKPDAEAAPPQAAAGAAAAGDGAASGPALEPEPDPFLGWVARIAAARGLTREQVLGQVAALQESMGGLLTAEAAVLLLARRNGLDVQAAAKAAADRMLRPAPGGGPAPARAGTP
jgi:hypothetical protein